MNAVYIGAGILLLLWISHNLRRRQKRRQRVICVIESRCTGCGRCVRRCSRHVLVKDEAGVRVVVKDPDKCTACGNCIDKCKFDALKLVERQ